MLAWLARYVGDPLLTVGVVEAFEEFDEVAKYRAR